MCHIHRYVVKYNIVGLPELRTNQQAEVRLKNYGLDAIEVVDNGGGISRDNHESIGLFPNISISSPNADLFS